jgi:hypothetical protein
MADLFRDTLAGKAFRLASGRRYLRYPEEHDPKMLEKCFSKDSSSESEGASGSFPALNWSRSRTSEVEKGPDVELVRWDGPKDPAVCPAACTLIANLTPVGRTRRTGPLAKSSLSLA